MSVSVAGMLQAGKEPVVEAAIVKISAPSGNRSCQTGCANSPPFVAPDIANRATLEEQLAFASATTIAPKLTVEGDDEILRGIIARGLGLR